MPLSTFVFLSVIITTTGSFIPVENPIYKEKVILGHFHHQIRQRRSENQHGNFFPENIRMTFNVKGSLVDLKLKRRDFTNDHLFDTGSLKYRPTDITTQPDFATYQNTTLDAGITMRCKERDLDKCIVHGTFREKNKYYQINPTQDESSEFIYEVNELRYRRSAMLGEQAVKYLETKLKHEENDDLKRKKRSVPRDSPLFTTYTVELAMWFDLSMYTRFMELNSNNPTSAMADLNVYAVGIANEVDIRLRNIDQTHRDMFGSSFECSGQLTYVLVCTLSSDCNWSTQRVSADTLTYTTEQQVVDFLVEFNGKSSSTKYDVYTGITLYTVTQNWSNRVEEIGMFYAVSTICNTNSWVVGSVITAKDGTAGFNFAHFIYHHFGGLGDGVDANCSESNNNVGSKRWSQSSGDNTAINPWQWSICGTQRIRNNINGGALACISDKRFSDGEFIRDHTEAYLGEVYSLNKQCAIATAFSASTFCGTQQPNMCNQGMSCTDASSTCTVSAVFPYTGTPCNAVGQSPGYCYEGLCRFDPTTTTTTPTTTTTTPTTTTTTPTTTTTTPTTTTTTPTTTTTTPTTTTTTPTTTTTTPTTTTTTPTTTTTTPTTTTTTPTTTTTTPTTTTTTPTTTTTTPTTTTTTPTTTTTTPTTTTTTPTTTTTTLTQTSTPGPTTSMGSTQTSTPGQTSAGPTQTSTPGQTSSAGPTQTSTPGQTSSAGPTQTSTPGQTSSTGPTGWTSPSERTQPTGPTSSSGHTWPPTGPPRSTDSPPLTTPRPRDTCLVPGGVPTPTPSNRERMSYKRKIVRPKRP